MNRKLRFIVKKKLYALVQFFTFTSDRKSCARIGVYAQRPCLRSFSKKFKKTTYFVLLRTPFRPYTPIKTVTSVYGLR